MHNEILDIFAEYENTGIQEVIQNLNSANSTMHIVNNSLQDSECGRISSLSEVFLEWYLFDSDKKRPLKHF